MAKKRLVNIFVICDSSFYEDAPVEGHIEFLIACNGVRAMCYTSQNLNRIRDDESVLSWDMNMAVTEALINTCDLILVIEDKLTKIPERELEIAEKTGKKKVYRTKWKNLNVTVHDIVNYIQANILIE